MDIKVVGSQNEIYQKQKLLGQGAFGKAYLVKRKADSQLLVIKEMNIDHMSEQQQKQTIKQAQILRNLNHPNIVKFVQVYVTKQNKLKIVMEYAQCGDLSKSISQHKKTKKHYDQSWILDWFTQICLAIKHVHDRKILHRDIKGQNIFITKSNTLKLGDFGIARVLNKTMEKARTVVGTPYYLSPQIIQNKPYSFKSDIWSIGVVLYQLCALTHPFTATSLQFLALKIVKGSFNPIPNHYSKQLKNLVSTMLSLDPNKRPSINDIFKNPLIQNRIKNFLTQTKQAHEFSHTVLHNHKVEILTNRLVEIKQQKDFQKERNKLKQEQELLKQKLQRKRSQEKLKLQQQEARQKEIQRERQKEKERQQAIQIQQRERQRQQQKRMDLLQKQRKQYQRKQAVLDEQRKKQQMQRKAQKEYQQRQKLAKYLQQKRKQDDQIDKFKQQQAQIMYRQNQREQEIKRMQKMRKMQQKQFQEEKKKRQLQQFARKQYFQNQQIMRRAKERANQDDYRENVVQMPKVYQREQIKNQNYGVKPSDNFHFQNKRKNEKIYQPTEQELQNAFVNPHFNKKNSSVINKNVNIQKNQLNKGNSQKKETSYNNQINSARGQAEKKHLSVRQQMKKDRQNFLKNKDGTKIEQTETKEVPPQNIPTIKAAKWQRPLSRQAEQLTEEKNQYTQKQQLNQDQNEQINNLGQRTYDLIGTKISPKDQQQFDRYLYQLEGLLQNVNKNIQDAEVKNAKNSPRKQSPSETQTKQTQIQQKAQQVQVKSSNFMAEMPEVEEIVYRQDDDDTLKFSMTAGFQIQFNKQNLLEKATDKLPQIQASTDLDYFSNFSKLQTLKMNLQDKFGTDNFVQLYRFLQQQMEQKGLQGFSNVNQVVDQIVKKFKINQNELMSSFTLLLTLIHMEQKMMSN